MRWQEPCKQQRTSTIRAIIISRRNKSESLPQVTQNLLLYLWGYKPHLFVPAVGGAPLSVIKQYIENQKNV